MINSLFMWKLMFVLMAGVLLHFLSQEINLFLVGYIMTLIILYFFPLKKNMKQLYPIGINPINGKEHFPKFMSWSHYES